MLGLANPNPNPNPNPDQDVSYSFDALKSVGDEGVNLESLLQARACTPCTSAPPASLHPLSSAIIPCGWLDIPCARCRCG